MANLVTPIIKNAVKYTKNGCRLVSKKTFAPETISHSLTPNGCIAVEIIETETHFGNGTATVFSFLGEDGKPLRKIITKGHNRKLKMTTRDYERVPTDFVGNDVLFTTTSFTENGALVQKNKESFFAYTTICDNTKAMKRTKLEMRPNADGSRSEKQIYEDWYPFIRNYFETTATRLKDGKVINKTISGNIKELEELQKDPYLYIRNYDKVDFTRSASWYAQRKQQVAGMDGYLIIDKIKGSSLGQYTPWRKSVTVDAEKHQYLTELVDTINHEYRHKYQHWLIDKLGSPFKRLFLRNKTLTQDEEKFAMKLQKAEKNYCQPEKDYDKYYSNFMEVDARKAGSEAADEYGVYSRRLAARFFMPTEMVHAQTQYSNISNFIKKAMQEGKVTVSTIPIKTAAKSKT